MVDGRDDRFGVKFTFILLTDIIYHRFAQIKIYTDFHRTAGKVDDCMRA